MAIRLLDPYLPDAEFSTVSPVMGETLPQVHEYDGYVVMGSEHSVLDQADWIDTLRKWIRDAAAADQPLVGICFGHQLMAQAFGAEVQRRSWVTGATDYSLTANSRTLCSVAYHHDHVVTLPEGAECWLSHSDCPIAGIAYQSFPGCSVQSHPEFSTSFTRALFEYTRGGELTEQQTDAAITSLSSPLEPEPIAQRFAATLSSSKTNHA